MSMGFLDVEMPVNTDDAAKPPHKKVTVEPLYQISIKLQDLESFFIQS
jgi:hypothetical protein